MKKVLLILVSVMLIQLAFGQGASSKFKPGVTLVYGTQINTLGINVLAYIPINEKFRVTPGFTYFIPNKNEFVGWTQTFSLWDANVDGNYIVPVGGDGFNFYALLGLNVSQDTEKGKVKDPGVVSDTYNYSKSAMNYGVNVGAGGEYEFSEKISGIVELKYKISSYSQFVIKAGVAFGL